MILTIYSSFKTVATTYITDLYNRRHNSFFCDSLTRQLEREVYPFIGETYISSIEKEQLIEIIHSLQSSEASISKVYLLTDNLKRIFRFAQAHLFLPENPCQDIKVPYPWNKHCRHFTETEVAYLHLGFKKCMLPDLFKFAFTSGVPLRECAALRKQNVDLTTGKCHITNEVYFKTANVYTSKIKPARSPRTIILPKECLKLLSSVENNSSDLFFTNVSGENIRQIDVASCLLFIKHYSGIHDFVVHQMLENFIYECVSIGVDVVSLENYCGYSSGYILKHYSTIENSHLPDAHFLANSSGRIS